MTVSWVALRWIEVEGRYWEATVGDFEAGDGVRFILQFMPSCYRRGQWKLEVEIAHGPKHKDWGCFDDQDQPMRWYHKAENAKDEAGSIAAVLLTDRSQHGPVPNWKGAV